MRIDLVGIVQKEVVIKRLVVFRIQLLIDLLVRGNRVSVPLIRTCGKERIVDEVIPLLAHVLLKSG